MLQTYLERWGYTVASAGEDRVMFAAPVPVNSVVNLIQGEAHLVHNHLDVDKIAVMDMCAYGVEGWLLPGELDTDLRQSNDLWDAYVPKMTSSTAFDTNDTADNASMFEPGETGSNALFDAEFGRPERVYRRRRIISINQLATYISSTDPDEYVPATQFTFKVSKRYKARQASGLLFGLGSPDFAEGSDNDVVPAIGGLNSFEKLAVFRHLADFLHYGLIGLVSLTEAGAETPFEDILGFMDDLLNQIGSKDTPVAGGTGFVGISWACGSRATIGIAVEGSMNVRSIAPNPSG